MGLKHSCLFRKDVSSGQDRDYPDVDHFVNNLRDSVGGDFSVIHDEVNNGGQVCERKVNVISRRDWLYSQFCICSDLKKMGCKVKTRNKIRFQ
jgi:hypothetical protein